MKTVCVACESARALLGYVRARCARCLGWYVGAPSKRGVLFFFPKKKDFFSEFDSLRILLELACYVIFFSL